MSFHAGHPASLTLTSPATGSKRLLVRLFPDQYENVRSALDIARAHVETDEDALYYICASFLLSETFDCNCLKGAGLMSPGQSQIATACTVLDS